MPSGVVVGGAEVAVYRRLDYLHVAVVRPLPGLGQVVSYQWNAYGPQHSQDGYDHHQLYECEAPLPCYPVVFHLRSSFSLMPCPV